MKKTFTLLATAMFSLQLLYGRPASQAPITYKQPDGSKLTLFCKGDEYGYWVETSNNDIIVRDDKGYFEYATIVNNEVVASGIRVKINADGNVMASPKNISSRNSICELISKQRNTIRNQLDSLNEIRNDQLMQQQRAQKAQSSSVTPLPQVKKQKVLCILMQFPDKPFSKTKADIDSMWNGRNYHEAGSQGSVWKFYKENSYDYVDVNATIVGPFTANYKYSHYKRTGVLVNTMAPEFVREAINKAINAGVKLKDYDMNGDNVVDVPSTLSLPGTRLVRSTNQ